MVSGHKRFNPTACPGSSWPVDMKWRVKTNTVYTPQEPEEPEEPTDPEPPTEPTEPDCCEVLALEVEMLKDRVSRLERMNLWDWFAQTPKKAQEKDNQKPE